MSRAHHRRGGGKPTALATQIPLSLLRVYLNGYPGRCRVPVYTQFPRSPMHSYAPSSDSESSHRLSIAHYNNNNCEVRKLTEKVITRNRDAVQKGDVKAKEALGLARHDHGRSTFPVTQSERLHRRDEAADSYDTHDWLVSSLRSVFPPPRSSPTALHKHGEVINHLWSSVVNYP